jgi:hypothetical protein
MSVYYLMDTPSYANNMQGPNFLAGLDALVRWLDNTVNVPTLADKMRPSGLV